MYINIAICDDKISICHQLEQYIDNYFSTKTINLNIEIYTSGNSLCEDLKSENFDLIFLDIELPGINGIQVGSFIRNIIHNDTVQIAYISAVQSYAMELFESRPINFLVKPLSYDKVSKVLDTMLKICGENENFFTFKVNGHFHKIPLSDILYFESHKRKITVITKNDSYEFYDSLKNVCNQISSPYFILIHQSLLINFNHISYFEYDRITMSDDTVLPISQSKRTEVKRIYLTLVKGDIHG